MDKLKAKNHKKESWIQNIKLVIKRDNKGIFRLFLKKGAKGRCYLFCPNIYIADGRIERTSHNDRIFLELCRRRMA